MSHPKQKQKPVLSKSKPTARRNGGTSRLCALLAGNRRGQGSGIYSICSANRFVLEAAMLQAQRDGSLLLIESTSNQVNQFGGYTGQTPEQFAKFVDGVAAEMNFPRQRILWGGDHLGPHVWRKESSAQAMDKAKEMIAAYVRAGFRKIHLDASMPCADDQLKHGQPLAEKLVATRAAELCRAAEESYRALSSSTPAPVYVIGTEVPVPGGEEFGSKAPEVTRTKNLANTLDVSKRAFLDRGLERAWERVIAVVVQPGVEFGDTNVFPYETKKAKALSQFLVRHWTGVYEAHSTDYQTQEALRQMVLDHFAILKVGPSLTFAFREAVFALAAMEKELFGSKAGVTLSGLPEVLDAAMLADPAHWKSYYRGDEGELHLARKYSYSDRIRYYWPQAAVVSAFEQLLHNLTANPAPHSVLSQYLPRQAHAVRFGFLLNQPGALIRDKILEVLEQYAYACGFAGRAHR